MSSPQQRADVIAAFPATGKTWLVDRNDDFADSDSSLWSPYNDWPDAYLDHIERMRADRQAVFVSTHKEVRDGLVRRGIPFTLVYPRPSLREEYRRRMVERGSPANLISKVIDELWDDALADCAAQEGCEHVVLAFGDYLADAVQVAR